MTTIEDYASIVGQDAVNELYSLAERSQDKCVQNINSTSVGGGVAELLSRLIPLFKQLGVEVNWDVINGDDRFFGITKKFHNALQGFDANITDEDLAYFLEINQMNAEMTDFYGDITFIHDPQPIALIEKKSNDGSKWVWRCHIDLTEPQMRPLNFLKQYIGQYDCAILSNKKYLQRTLGTTQRIISPSIDPLSEKNKELSDGTIASVLNRFEIDYDRPIVTQISRFDKLKNPCGVIDAYKEVKRDIDCQLVLAGGGATDDPEGPGILEKVNREAESDTDIHVIDLPPTSDLEVNALQRASTVVLQNSIKEGFGLTVTEALWKAKPVIASAVGGIPLQINHNQSGILTNSFEDTVYYLKKLLLEPDYARRLGINGRANVKNNFLITRHIRECLMLFISLYDESYESSIKRVAPKGLEELPKMTCEVI
jgi:trehalose synthase